MKYKIQSEAGNLTIKTEVEPSQLGKSLLRISNAMGLKTLIVTDITEHTFIWAYSKVSEVREQLETLVIQNVKDAWEERKAEHIQDGLEAGDTLEELQGEEGWEDAKEDFLKDYFYGLETLIKQESGLFK